MGKIRTVLNRIYSDYLMSSRLSEYEAIITKALELEYEHLSVNAYQALLKANMLGSKRYFLHRHDIDTDARTARKLFEIEKKHNIRSTFYFRLSTLDFDLMREIHDYGSEASYHFEEIAQYCKDHGIHSQQAALEHLPEIREVFIENVKRIESYGIKITTVASHGDFVNRKLKLTNNRITDDKSLRKTLGLELETYDEDFMQSLGIYVSDRPYPTYYSPQNIFDVLGNYDVICMLSHPRQWKTNWVVNTKDNLGRVYEGLKWRPSPVER